MKNTLFICDNCGFKPTLDKVVEFNATCEVCGDTIIAYTVDCAEAILKLERREKELVDLLAKFDDID